MEDKKEQIVDVRSVVEAVSAEDDEVPIYEVESLCMRCHENGVTRLMLTLIPHFRKILLSAFECPHCGERNNEVQFAGELQPRGCCYTLKVPAGDPQVPELDFEIPPEAQRGSLSTIEGILSRAADGLEVLQDERRKVDPKTAEALDQFLEKLRACATGSSSFTFIVDDPAGNSFIENPHAPSSDPWLSLKFYERTPEQQEALGYVVGPSQEGDFQEGDPNETVNPVSDGVSVEPHGSVGARAGRRAIAQGNTDQIAEALCRYTSPEELKPGGSTSNKAKRIIVHVENIEDLNRDVIKSDSACVNIPEVELELASGTLGGMVTTIEGLVTKIRETLERVHGFTFGDGLEEGRKGKWQEFSTRMNKLLELEEPWTLIIDDALANSFVSPITDDLKDDTQLTSEEYERSWEQNEEFGLNDMDTSSADAAYNAS
ncbi:hypothetical protein KSS87_003136 [Heliosperma pusillum]|nr:hypothetical protein KSS87_003136 [Heliosperma pusillum]